jgi:hypothetical protein
MLGIVGSDACAWHAPAINRATHACVQAMRTRCCSAPPPAHGQARPAQPALPFAGGTRSASSLTASSMVCIPDHHTRASLSGTEKPETGGHHLDRRIHLAAHGLVHAPTTLLARRQEHHEQRSGDARTAWLGMNEGHSPSASRHARLHLRRGVFVSRLDI